MAEKVIQIADKPTLDEVKALLENSGYGLEAIKDAIGSGGSSGGGGLYNYTIGSSLDIGEQKSVSTLPYQFSSGEAVVYNDEIHIMGSNIGECMKNHYKWDGETWESVSTLPLEYNGGSQLVILNNEIHLVSGYSSAMREHYKWDGSSWTRVSTMPYDFYNGGVVVYNGEIYIIGGGGGRSKMYKWDGSSWISVGSTYNSFYCGSAVVLNNEIHVLGGVNTTTAHYKWDGSSWTSVSTLSYAFYNGRAVVFKNKIHLLGNNASSGYNPFHNMWDGTSWKRISNLPYNLVSGASVVFRNNIHIIGGDYGQNNHYTVYTGKYDATLKLFLKNGAEVMGESDVFTADSSDDTWEQTDYGSYKAKKSGECVIGLQSAFTKDTLAEKAFSIF